VGDAETVLLGAVAPEARPDGPRVDRGGAAPARGGRWLLPFATALLVFVLAFIAGKYRFGGSTVAIWWPAAGVAVAAYAVAWRRRQQRAAVLVAVVVSVFAGELLAGYDLDVSFFYALANLANPVLCVWLFSRTTPTLRIRDARDYAQFCLAAFFAATVTAGIASLIVCVFIDDDPWAAYGAVLPSHLSAILVIAPIVLLAPWRQAPAGRLETALQVASTLSITFYVFAPYQKLPVAYLCVGFLVWGATRVSATWLHLQVVLVAVIAAVGTSLGFGDYAADLQGHSLHPEASATLLDVMLIGIALAVYPLALAREVHRSSLAEAQESRELLDSVLTGATGNAIIGADLDGVIQSWNSGAERIFGFPARDVCGRRTLGTLRGATPTRASGRGLEPELAALVAPLTTGSDWVDQDWECVRQDGRRITVAFRLTARRSADGEVLGWIAVGGDVTEKRRTERALKDALERDRQAVQRLEELDAVKTSFVHSVSHELRTPMTNVLGYTDMLLEEQLGAVNPSQRKMLMSVSRNGRRLHKLIEDLLTLSRIEQGSFTALTERVDLRTAVSRGCKAIASQAEAASVRFEIDLGEDPAPVHGDLEQLERITVNLLGNAVKFSAGGSVAVAVDRGDGEAVLTIADQGMGIPSAEAAQLFERFFRSSNAQRAEVQGSGLGLVIVKEIVDYHHGRIEVDSEEGAGTTVRVRLPLQVLPGACGSVEGQKALSGSSISARSVDSALTRSAASLGST